MKRSDCFSIITILSFILLVTAVLNGCKNRATGSEAEEDHFPVGAIIKMYINGEEEDIVRYESPSSITGSIEIAAEDTALASIYFLAEDGDEFQPDDPEHSLRWSVEDESIAEVVQNTENGKWSFRVLGKISDSTTSVIFELMHDSHPEFTTPGIPINVN